ncbi:MAG: hypothetical protein K2O73_05475 [Lachnospiraceae bacterium]|nr:hypothetical protein [Lachnospiraceae bacterium]
MRLRALAAILLPVIICSAALTGCSSTELEERNFPLAAYVDITDEGYKMQLGFEQLKDVSSDGSDKENNTSADATGTDGYALFQEAQTSYPGEMDYNHMKALILGEALIEDDAKRTELLSYLEEQNVIARNTLLFVSGEDMSDMMGMQEKLKEAVGIYLDTLIASDKQLKDRAAVTLGSMFQAQHNNDENLWIPYLTLGEEEILFSDYYLMQGKRAKGILSRQTGEAALLSEHKLQEYAYVLEDGAAIRLSNFQCEYALETQDSPNAEQPLTEVIRIRAEAKRMDQRMETVEDQKELQRQAQRQMEQWMQQQADLLAQADVDISNSYYRLGGYGREVYDDYQNDWQGYRRDLNIRFEWEVRPVSR